jgi:hypothetical protein
MGFEMSTGWRHSTHSSRVSVMSDTAGLTTDKHIYVAHKGDYYDIADNVPQLETH